jgi:hypothetical protein
MSSLHSGARICAVAAVSLILCQAHNRSRSRVTCPRRATVELGRGYHLATLGGCKLLLPLHHRDAASWGGNRFARLMRALVISLVVGRAAGAVDQAHRPGPASCTRDLAQHAPREAFQRENGDAQHTHTLLHVFPLPWSHTSPPV